VRAPCERAAVGARLVQRVDDEVEEVAQAVGRRRHGVGRIFARAA
jgi:hypothetical protein